MMTMVTGLSQPRHQPGCRSGRPLPGLLDKPKRIPSAVGAYPTAQREDRLQTPTRRRNPDSEGHLSPRPDRLSPRRAFVFGATQLARPSEPPSCPPAYPPRTLRSKFRARLRDKGGNGDRREGNGCSAKMGPHWHQHAIGMTSILDYCRRRERFLSNRFRSQPELIAGLEDQSFTPLGPALV